MLKNILSGESCAKCRLCCIFDKYDVWETPVITRELYTKISAARPELKMVSKGGNDGYIFNMEGCWDEEEEIYRCPALDPEKGCTLGENKPFDCSIWPFRVMDLNGARVISIASVCPELYKLPLNVLVGELENGLADIIFAEAAKNPAIVKPYQQGYPILKVRTELCSKKVRLAEVTRGDLTYLCELYNRAELLDRLGAGNLDIEDWDEEFEQWREDGDEEDYIIYYGSEPAGWVKLSGLESGGCGWISMLVIDPEFRGHGISRECIRLAEEIFIEKGINSAAMHVYSSNEAAEKCCLSCGYTPVSDDTGDGEAVMYKKEDLNENYRTLS
ncbi:MAG: GNAT family N-acetyltransferase [Oscillospiraceae bacterium]|nr:GNAT family N-acetyltransferase [Oscillospiraceae bacterium]